MLTIDFFCVLAQSEIQHGDSRNVIQTLLLMSKNLRDLHDHNQKYILINKHHKIFLPNPLLL